MLCLDKTALLDFVNQRMPECARWENDGSCAVIGWEKKGKIVAVVIYDQFYWPSITAHIVSDGSKTWATKGFIKATFDYPFRQLNCQRVTLPIAENNKDAIKLAMKLGFVLEGRLRKALPDGQDRLIFGMLREECRWFDFAVRGLL